MVFFERIRLKNWRNFESADVQLARRVFVVGQNASGKSNFLDAFRFLHDLVVPGGGFLKAVEDRGGVKAIRWFGARRDPNVLIEVDVSTDGKERWRYRIKFGLQQSTGKPVVKEECIWRREGEEWESVLERRLGRGEEAGLFEQTYVEQRAVSANFKSLVDAFASVSYVHLAPQIIREPAIRRYVPSLEWLGADWLKKVMSTNRRTTRARFRRIKDALRSVTGLQVEEIDAEMAEEGPILRVRCSNWRSYGLLQDERILSDGSIRLIVLLWSLLEKGGPLLWEEPEESLHPAVVRQLPPLFAQVQREGGRQVILTTHSPDLLHDEGISGDEIILLQPQGDKTEAIEATKKAAVRELLRRGIPPGEVVLDVVAPKERLLFDL